MKFDAPNNTDDKARDLADVLPPAIEQRLDAAEEALALALLLSSALAQAGDLELGHRVTARAHQALVAIFDHGWKSVRAIEHALYRCNDPALNLGAPDLNAFALHTGEDSSGDSETNPGEGQRYETKGGA